MAVMVEDEAPGHRACENLQGVEWNQYSRAVCTVSPIEALWKCDLAGFGGGERFGSAVRAVWDTITEGRLDGACPPGCELMDTLDTPC